jgi:Fe-S oxidoreductase
VGGTISGEHGTGLSRSGFVRGQYHALYEVFRQVKQLFDPLNILNPGKVLNDDAQLIVRHLRPLPAPATVELELKWKPDELRQAALRCNGCGHCRTQESALRMCPVFRHDPKEEASPRAKANLMRLWLAGQLPPDSCTTPEFKQIADLCFNCKQCQSECPSNVNIPQMMIEAKAAYVAAHGLTRWEWALSRAHAWGAMGAGASGVFNWALSNPAARFLIEKCFGISRLRKLPRFARRSFLRMAPRELLARPALERGARPVVYFVDHFANYHDPALARAFVAILRHHGVSVHVPPRQWASGLAMVSAGDLEGARELALANVRELADLAREGCTIVCTEPSAAICLKQEYPRLLDHPDVETVADRVMDAGAYLERLREEGRLRRPVAPLELTAGYHQPCHLKALDCGTPLAGLVDLIPGMKLHRIEEGCSGMAGAWGLSKDNFVHSLRIGWGLISRMRMADLTVGLTECSSCKMQMEQGTQTPTLHPLKLLALSYGLMPELKEKLKPSRSKLLIT